MPEESVVTSMRSDWNERAREDANYYVAFGRRDQTEEEFFASAADQVRAFETELGRKPAGIWRSGTALEIGCGPGRLLRPLSRHFREIHGVDISDEMIGRARANLRGSTNIHLHHAGNSDLSHFDPLTIDFVYSYAVFQHIPSKQAIFTYLHEAVRVLKPGGLFVFQINSLPERGHVASTWEGVSVSSEEIMAFARSTNMLLLALNDKETQYTWVTLQKPEPRADLTVPAASIFRITDVHTGDGAIPASGRLGAASIWMNRLPDDCHLLDLRARIDGRDAFGCYISPPTNGLRFFNVILPPDTRTGLLPVEITWMGRPLGSVAWARVIPPGPRIARISYVADGFNLLSRNRIVSGFAKLVMEEVEHPNDLQIRIGDEVVPYEWFCVNPHHERYDFNFALPAGVAPGPNALKLTLGAHAFAPVPVEIAPGDR